MSFWSNLKLITYEFLVKSEDIQWNLNNFLEHPGAKNLGLNFQVSNITLFHLERELWGGLGNHQ